MDWLSRLLDMMPVSGNLDIRCSYGAPWRVAYDRSKEREVPYHIILRGTAMLDDPGGGPSQQLSTGDIVVLMHGAAHILRDGSSTLPAPVSERKNLNVTISENAGAGERLEMLCGHFILTAPHDRLVRAYLPPKLVVRAGGADSAEGSPATTGVLLAGLVTLMQAESAGDNLGGHAMLNALQAALFALTLRLASEADQAPTGLLALAGYPRLASALTAMFQDPAHAWTLPELAGLCNMSRATLARHFDEKLGRSASDLLKDIRMTLAANTLRNPSLSTEAVAESVGYQSVTAFMRAFKEHAGMTPADWRRMAQTKVQDAPMDTVGL
jgi:AraC family transcriptional activator of mtrCDE